MVNAKTKNACIFYVSEYHFEMIALSNINKEIEQNKKIIVITEENLKETVKILLSKVNFKTKNKEIMESINWSNNNEDKYSEIKKYANEKQEMVIYIKGSEEFIEKQNEKIEQMLKENQEQVDNISIIDCYNLGEIQERVKVIEQDYSNVLVTKG